MSRYHRENPDAQIIHDWLEGVQHVNVDPAKGKDSTETAIIKPLPCGYCTPPTFKGWHNGKCPYCGKPKPL